MQEFGRARILILKAYAEVVLLCPKPYITMSVTAHSGNRGQVEPADRFHN